MLAERWHGDVEQQDIARRLGVSASAITKWKNGTEPSPDAVRAAAEAYRDYVKAPNELLIELLQIAYVPGPRQREPKKRTPKGQRDRRSAGNPQDQADRRRLTGLP